jgi:Ca2+-binding RTX toxin-like protein
MSRQGWVAAAIATLAAALLVPASASADNSFTCRGSAARVTLGGTNVIAEPTVANRPNDPCTGDAAGIPEVQVLGAPQLQQATTRNAYARTAMNRIKPSPADWSSSAEAGVDHTDALSDPSGGWVVTADGVNSHANAYCAGSQPEFKTTSTVASLILGGQPVPTSGQPDKGLQDLFDQLNANGLDQLVKVQVNPPEVRNGNTVTKVALEITLAPGGNPIADVVLGESQAGANCVVPPNPPRCPDGFEYDVATGTCVQVITVPGTGNPRQPCPDDAFSTPQGTCVKNVYVPVVGNSAGVQVFTPPTPGAGGTGVLGATAGGGRVPSARLGPCTAKRFDGSFLILGTDGDDTITGTNQNDIILAGGGNDRASGGDGNDCIRGEAGNDRVDGSNANDTVLGDAGKNVVIGGRGNDILRGDKGADKLDGGIGNDNLRDKGGRNFLLGGAGTNRITGGTGRDFITTGSGHNVVNAGRGNDQINAAKAGPPTRGTCGPGRDVERGNKNEVKTIHSCERKFIVFLTH